MPSSDTVKVVDQFLQPSGVCGKGLNSPLEIIRVGTGERNAARSAGFVRANSRLNPVLLMAFRPHRRVNARTDFSKCSSLFGSAIFARAAPGINSTTRTLPRPSKPGDRIWGWRAIIAIS